MPQYLNPAQQQQVERLLRTPTARSEWPTWLLFLAMVRSYYEHRAADDCKHRIVINEAAWPMRLLFLNNNYHLVHHDLPDLPWYLQPVVYRANREDYLRRCGGFLVAGYGELIRRFGLTPVDAPLLDIAGS